MPCWTIKKTAVNVSQMDLAILADGLKAAGFDVSHELDGLVFSEKGTYLYHNYKAGVLTLSGVNIEEMTSRVKRAYSAQVVRHSVQQFGWKMNSTNNQQFVVTKRR